MIQKNKNNKPDKDLDALLEKAQETYDEQTINVSNSEVNVAFQQVARKTTYQKNAYDRKFIWKFASAAAILIIVAIGILFMALPHNVQAPEGNIKTVNLSDGTIVTLNDGSKLTYSRWFGIWGRDVSVKGEAFFDVTHTGTPFRVKAGHGRITVTGTKFDVRTDGDKTSVYLKEGEVRFSSNLYDEHAVILLPGEYSRVSIKQPIPLQPKKINFSKVISWVHPGLSFTDQPLSVIFDKISSRFDVKIQTIPKDLSKEKLTIYLSKLENAEQVIADICRAKGWKYTQKDNAFIITRSL